MSRNYRSLSFEGQRLKTEFSKRTSLIVPNQLDSFTPFTDAVLSFITYLLFMTPKTLHLSKHPISLHVGCTPGLQDVKDGISKIFTVNRG